ncbi:hypothetical protein BKA69DRAFT_1126795 [Paraphysoderma sedebokerense]|nr:hypothetical protein BKA69DRAFT_1126795 [Paraphysoderma sedebokerense]
MTAFKTVTLLLIIVSVASVREFASAEPVIFNLSKRCNVSVSNLDNAPCIRNMFTLSFESRQVGNDDARRHFSDKLPHYCSSNCGTQVEIALKNITASCTETKEDLAFARTAQGILQNDRPLACHQVSNHFCALKKLELEISSGINDHILKHFTGFSTPNVSDYSKVQIEKLPKDVVCNDCVNLYINNVPKVDTEKKGEDCARKRYYENIVSYCANNSYTAQAYPNSGGKIGAATVSSSAFKSSNFIAALGGAIAFVALVFA